MASYNGTVTGISSDKYNGNMITVKYADGSTVKYAHLSDTMGFKAGDKVTAGETIAKSGNTGASTGAHLHVSVINANGQYIDPAGYLGL